MSFTESSSGPPRIGVGSTVPVFSEQLLAFLLKVALDETEKVIEIDRFNAGLGGALVKLQAARANLHQFLPQSYVSDIEAMGLVLSPENELRTVTMIGDQDVDLAVRRPPLQLWRGHPITRRKIRRLDTLFDADRPIALLILGMETALETLHGGMRLLGIQSPLIAIRVSTRSDARPILDFLRTISDYEWTDWQIVGEPAVAAGSHRYALAAAANWRPRLFECETDVELLLNVDRLLASPAGVRLHFEPDEFVATDGLYDTEREGGTIWRWGGIGDRLAFLIEPKLTGDCEARLDIINAMPGVLEAITFLAMNGCPISARTMTDRFEFETRVETPFVLQIGCGAAAPPGSDFRRLNLALGPLKLRLKTLELT